MGVFLNRGTEEFESAVNSLVYVDKTEMIGFLNRVVNTEQRYICVSGPRRFGKTITANMLAAYYEKDSNARELFADRKLGKETDWDRYLNRFDVLRIDVAYVMSITDTPDEALRYIENSIVLDLKNAFPDIAIPEGIRPAPALDLVSEQTKTKFVLIIDEWDALFSADKMISGEAQSRYIDLLCSLFKGNNSKKFTALAYITGILPIRRYISESALNNFDEYTMLNPDNLAEYIGFTEADVQDLCGKHAMNFEEITEWYGGYVFEKPEFRDGIETFKQIRIYEPESVVKAVNRRKCDDYWPRTAAFNSLAEYIRMNFDGLKVATADLVRRERVRISISGFGDNLTSFRSRDDVMTVLIHLGYLAYDRVNEEAYIPNKQVLQSYKAVLEVTELPDVDDTIRETEELLNTLARWNTDDDGSGE